MKKRDADARQKVVCWMLVDEGGIQIKESFL